jgi:hypothetical protein
LVEGYDIDAALRQPRQPLVAARRMDDREPGPRQAAVDQPGQGVVVIDIQEGRGHLVHMAAWGT